MLSLASMFLSRRSTQAEYFDAPRPFAEVRHFFTALNRLNGFFAFAEPFQRFTPRLIGEAACQSLSILDLGAGDGSLGRVLTSWAAERGWNWRVTNLDLNPDMLRLNPDGTNVVGSVLALPFPDRSFDFVIASQMTHHLSEPEAVIHVREAWRVTRRALCVADLHRNLLLYGVLWALFCFRRFPRSFRQDALLSVKRAWRVPELRRIALEARIPNPTVKLYFGARIILHALKPQETGTVFPSGLNSGT